MAAITVPDMRQSMRTNARNLPGIGPRPGAPIFAQSMKVAYSAVPSAIYGDLRPIGEAPFPLYTIAGTAFQRTESGDVPLARCKLVLFHKKTRLPVAQVTTAADGTYTFNNLMPGVGMYFAIAFDPDSAPVQNALILDRLTAE